MKRLLLLTVLSLPLLVSAQFAVSFHQSNLPFIGINYEIKNRIRPEIRIGTDNYFEDTSLEGVVNFDLFNKPEYELYAGIGVRVNLFTGMVVPLGINVYPFSARRFGFQMELSPFFGEDFILRGSWGIRYRFAKE